MRAEDPVLTGHTVEELSFLQERVFVGFLRSAAQGAGPVPAIQDGVALRVERLFAGPWPVEGAQPRLGGE
jgi:hypothetical protein